MVDTRPKVSDLSPRNQISSFPFPLISPPFLELRLGYGFFLVPRTSPQLLSFQVFFFSLPSVSPLVEINKNFVNFYRSPSVGCTVNTNDVVLLMFGRRTLPLFPFARGRNSSHYLSSPSGSVRLFPQRAPRPFSVLRRRLLPHPS